MLCCRSRASTSRKRASQSSRQHQGKVTCSGTSQVAKGNGPAAGRGNGPWATRRTGRGRPRPCSRLGGALGYPCSAASPEDALVASRPERDQHVPGVHVDVVDALAHGEKPTSSPRHPGGSVLGVDWSGQGQSVHGWRPRLSQPTVTASLCLLGTSGRPAGMPQWGRCHASLKPRRSDDTAVAAQPSQATSPSEGQRV
jgi:hypothetical protein